MSKLDPTRDVPTPVVDSLMEQLDTRRIRRSQFLKVLGGTMALGAAGSLLAACGSSDSTAAAGTAGTATAATDGKIAVTNFSLVGDYSTEWNEAATAAARQLGLSAVNFDGRSDATVQQDQFNQALTQGVKGTYILASDPGIVQGMAKSANDAKMYFANAWAQPSWFTPWDSGPYYTEYIQADEWIGTAEATEALLAKIGHEGQVARVGGFPGGNDTTEGWRKSGFVEVVEKYPKVDFVEEVYGKYDPQTSQEVTGPLLTKYPELRAIAAINDDAALGVIAAIRAAGKTPGKDIYVIGANGSKQGVKNIRDGIQVATTGNVPSYASYQIVTNFYDHLNGWTPNEAERLFTWRPVTVTSENVDKYLARYVDNPIDQQFSATLLSRTLTPDAWDLQFEAYPIPTIDRLFTGQKKPSGYQYPAAYTKAQQDGSFDEIRALYKEHYKTDVLGPSPVTATVTTG
jgi:ribose transport system substrate-binding protein